MIDSLKKYPQRSQVLFQQLLNKQLQTINRRKRSINKNCMVVEGRRITYSQNKEFSEVSYTTLEEKLKTTPFVEKKKQLKLKTEYDELLVCDTQAIHNQIIYGRSVKTQISKYQPSIYNIQFTCQNNQTFNIFQKQSLQIQQSQSKAKQRKDSDNYSTLQIINYPIQQQRTNKIRSHSQCLKKKDKYTINDQNQLIHSIL